MIVVVGLGRFFDPCVAKQFVNVLPLPELHDVSLRIRVVAFDNVIEKDRRLFAQIHSLNMIAIGPILNLRCLWDQHRNKYIHSRAPDMK